MILYYLYEDNGEVIFSLDYKDDTWFKVEIPEENLDTVKKAIRKKAKQSWINSKIEELNHKKQEDINNLKIPLIIKEPGEAIGEDPEQDERDTFIFDADELSQTRLSRALLLLPNDDITIEWLTADNQKIDLRRNQIRELLKKAAEKTAEIVLSYNTLKEKIRGEINEYN